MATRVIRIDRRAPLPDELAPAVRALRAGRLVAFPTETVYGLGVVAIDDDAVERLRQLKNRPSAPFTVHIAGRDEVSRYVADVPFRARLLLKKAWPGPVTVLLKTDARHVDSSLGVKGIARRICPEGVVGLRCPDDRVAGELLQRAEKTVLATSANLTGQPPPHSAEDVLAQLDGRIDLVIDAGPARFTTPSTIVAFEDGRCRIVRQGVYDARAIDGMTRYSVLFVCTGNTCRSPIAAALARKLLAERLNVPPERLEEAGVQVSSAGIFGGGAPVSRQAVAAAARLGADIERHRSRTLTAELIRSADVVFCMTQDQLAEVTELAGDAPGKAFLLDPSGDIEDPAGRDEQTYLDVARRIADNLEKRIRENWP